MPKPTKLASTLADIVGRNYRTIAQLGEGAGKYVGKTAVISSVIPGTFNSTSVIMSILETEQVDLSETFFRSFDLKELVGDTANIILEQLKQATKVQHRLKKVANVITSTGGDPEFFVEDELGAIIPAFRFLPDKAHGLPIHYKNNTQNTGDIQRLYWDGLQLEFTITAAHCHEERVASFRSGMIEAIKEARKICPKAKLSSKTVIEVDDEFLASTDPKFLEFGCAPSFNAYDIPSKLGDGRTARYRSTGGHIHFGLPTDRTDAKFFDNHDDKKVIPFIKWLDAIVGIGLVCMVEQFDSPIRRQYYGLPGEFRKPEYGKGRDAIPGIEWRTPSNAYLFHPTATNLVLDMARAAANFSFAEKLTDVWQGNEKEVIETIIACDVKAARKIMDRNKELFLYVARKAYPNHGIKMWEATFNAFYKGMGSIVKNPSKIEENWSLDDPEYYALRHSQIWWKKQAYLVMEGKLCV